MIRCTKCRGHMVYYHTQGIYWIYKCDSCGATRIRSSDYTEMMFNNICEGKPMMRGV